jgi:esterase
MKLAYRDYGEGTPLIILHGLFGQSDNWNTLAKKFAQEGLHAFTVDQRNHGLSPHSDKWDYGSMAADLKEFIEDHRLQEPVVLGHSMGAKTTMFFEHIYPGAASRLIIADMAARRYESHHADVLKALNAVDFSEIKTRKEAEAVLQQYINDFGTRQFLLKNIYRREEGNEQMDWRFNLPVITAKYENIRVEVPFYKSNVPVLVLRGGASKYVQNTDLEDFKNRYPNLEHVTIEGAGHWVHAEKPDEFFNSVMRFIKGPVA